MNYVSNGKEIHIGDRVFIGSNTEGVVVCDFAKWECLEGYGRWLIKSELVGGGRLSTGILVETKDLGFLHYAEEDEDIRPAT